MKPATSPAAISHRPTAAAARIAAAGTVAVALTILALHAIKPELAPSWRFTCSCMLRLARLF